MTAPTSSFISPADGAALDQFGYSVASSASGRIVVVGGAFDDVGGNDGQGSARVFVFNGSAWVQRGAALTAGDGAPSDQFGWSVAMSADGNTVVVGGIGDDVGGNADQGSARVFDWNGSTWTQRGEALTPADGAGGDRFGTAVAVSADGNIVVVGGDGDDVGGRADQGSARVFAWNGSAWEQRGAGLTPSDGAAGDLFGWSVAASASGNTVVIGGYADDVGGNANQGSARVFDWDGTAWVARGGALSPADGAAADSFGRSVAVSQDGNTVVVGGDRDDVGAGTNQGTARVFVWNGSAWEQRGAPLTPADGALGDWWGAAVAVSADGNIVVVGGPLDDVPGANNQGSARVFVWNGSAWEQRGAALTPADGAFADWFAFSTAVSDDGNTVILGGSLDNVGANADQGSARVFTWNGTAWIEGIQGLNLSGDSLANLLDGGQDNDTLSGLGGNDTLNGLAGDDDLRGGSGHDLLNGGDGADLLGGGGGNDVLEGGAGADTLNGQAGNDTLRGGAGNDLLAGSAGDDAMEGGLGDDVYIVTDAGDTVVEVAGGGRDLVRASVSFTLGAEVEDLILTAAGSTGTGNAGRNVLSGSAGEDTLDGAGGNDVIIGGKGADVLIGGAGRDLFVFLALDDSTGAMSDLITDFTQRFDRIDLRRMDASGAPGDQAFGFVGTGAFTGGGAGSVRFEVAGGETLVQVDTGDGGAADMVIRLTGNISLTAGDFLL